MIQCSDTDGLFQAILVGEEHDFLQLGRAAAPYHTTLGCIGFKCAPGLVSFAVSRVQVYLFAFQAIGITGSLHVAAFIVRAGQA